MTVKRNVCQTACWKDGLLHSVRKLSSPTHFPCSSPAVAFVKLSMIARTSGPPTSASTKMIAGEMSTDAKTAWRSKTFVQRLPRGRAAASASTPAPDVNAGRIVFAGARPRDCGRAFRVPAAAMAEITLEKLTKVYGDGTRAVSELDLEIDDGEFVVLVGPSGCGKTSALRMVAGLEPITSGRVLIGGEVVNKLPPKDRDIAMIFQNYALYPHMSAFDNMAFGLKLRGMKRQRRGGARDRNRTRRSGWRRCCRRSRGRSRAASASGSRWAGRSCASRGRS